MTTHAYNQLYLSKCSRSIGFMLHTAIIVHKIDGTDFLNRFIQSGIAKNFEDGSSKYIAGKSGIEIFREVMEITTCQEQEIIKAECYDRSPEYWIGWVLTHYQWYSNRSFRTILEIIPYTEFLSLYKTLHEADIHKCYEVFDARFFNAESRLKFIRKKCGLTQEQLAIESNVSLNTIKAYERKSKALNKAQFDIVMRLANALKCEVTELI